MDTTIPWRLPLLPVVIVFQYLVISQFSIFTIRCIELKFEQPALCFIIKIVPAGLVPGIDFYGFSPYPSHMRIEIIKVENIYLQEAIRIHIQLFSAI